jgi:hypothetical protein
MNWIENIAVFVVAGALAVVAAIVGFKIPVMDAVIGSAILVVITLIGILVARIMPGNLPMVFWVSIVAILSTSSISPVAATVTQYTAKIDFLAICTVVLAYAGLTVGKDLEMFKKMSWRIIVVALAVYTGTFLCATLVAEIMLHLEGII